MKPESDSILQALERLIQTQERLSRSIQALAESNMAILDAVAGEHEEDENEDVGQYLDGSTL